MQVLFLLLFFNFSSRNVTSLFENQNENVDYILPVMTQPYDIKMRR